MHQLSLENNRFQLMRYFVSEILKLKSVERLRKPLFHSNTYLYYSDNKIALHNQGHTDFESGNLVQTIEKIFSTSTYLCLLQPNNKKKHLLHGII